MDRNLIKDLKYLWQKVEDRKKNRKYAVLCDHVFAPLVFGEAKEVIRTKATHHHEKHNGYIYACTNCSLLFDSVEVSKRDTFLFHPVEDIKVGKYVGKFLDR